MMINKRLINLVANAKKYIKLNILFQWIAMIFNVVFVFNIAAIINVAYHKHLSINNVYMYVIIMIVSLVIRFICNMQASKMAYHASSNVKVVLREKLYTKLLKIGVGYQSKFSTSTILQVSIEGIEQLEIYFARYLPQFFYSLLAPLTLFIILVFINPLSAIVLLVCVPLIPMSIIMVQKFAKKLLAKYWGEYTMLGDHFLENVEGLNTLKIYNTDEFKNEEMNKQAERFRIITMKVLSMQLNSITLMDLVAFGGAALGIIVALLQYQAGNLNLPGTITIILLSAEFFIPLRLLGSYFHIAMNGISASDKIFSILDEELDNKKVLNTDKIKDIKVRDLSLSIDKREILSKINLDIAKNQFISIVGESGSGKSSLAKVLMGIYEGYTGNILVNEKNYHLIKEEAIMENITYIPFNGYIFAGSVKDNLKVNKQISDQDIEKALKKVNLYDFIMQEGGLSYQINEGATNLSGGQKQRLVLARAILHDSSVWILDEATSNIDVESESIILDYIKSLKNKKTIILISHRLAATKDSDCIHVMKNGKLQESGSFKSLMGKKGIFNKLYTQQENLESYLGGHDEKAQ